MPQDIRCPGCKKTLRVPDSLAGKKGKCPACGTSIDIPVPAAQAGVSRADKEAGLPGTAETAAPPEDAAAPPSPAGLFPVGERFGLPGKVEEKARAEEEQPAAPQAGLFPAREKLGLPGETEEKKGGPPAAREESPGAPKDSGRTAERYSLAGASLKYALAHSFVKGEESYPLLDISRKGVGFKLVLKPKKKALQTVQLKPDIKSGDMVNLTIDIQAFVTTMKAKGRVTRVKPLEEKNAYLVGVEFTEMAPGEAERLKKLETSEDLRQTKRTSEYI